MPRSQRPPSSRSGAAPRKSSGTPHGKSGATAKPKRFGEKSSRFDSRSDSRSDSRNNSRSESRSTSRTPSRFGDADRKRSGTGSSTKSGAAPKRFSAGTGTSRTSGSFRSDDDTKRPYGKSSRPSSSAKSYSEKKFSDRKFEDKKFGDKKFGDRKSDRKFDDKKFGDKKFSDRKFGDRKFEGKKPSFDKSVNKRSEERPTATPIRSQKGKSREEAKGFVAQPLRQSSAIVRLNKFLADSGICSRRQADELIEQGLVKVNGTVITEHGTRVHLSDLVTVRGEPVNAEKHLTYIVLNKPKDYITTTSDEKGRKTVMDLIPIHSRVYPVGRLDRHTTGVLLFTNDGEIAHRLMHPSYRVSRIYMAYLDKRLSAADGKRISTGVEITGEDDESYISGECNVLIDPNDPRSVLLELAEGKNREVRRIFETLGYEVEKLDRREYATITTRGLERGEYRHLTLMEIRTLEKLVGLETRYERETTAAKPRTKERTKEQSKERPQSKTAGRTTTRESSSKRNSSSNSRSDNRSSGSRPANRTGGRSDSRSDGHSDKRFDKRSGAESSAKTAKISASRRGTQSSEKTTTKPRILKRPSIKKLTEE